MNLSLVLKRTRREWRQLGVLIVAICLVTAFFALGPLYVRTMVQSGLQYELSAINNANLNLTLISPQPYKPESWELVNRQLGSLNGGLVRVARSQAAFGGFQFAYSEPITEASPRSGIGNRVFAFSHMKSILKLVDGRWPERLAPPGSPERSAATENERIAKGLGVYSRGDVEAVMTGQVAAIAGMELGTRFVIGERPENHVVVNVVGIVEAVNPADPIWSENSTALEGELTDLGPGRKHYDMSFFVTEGAYSDWIAKATQKGRTDDNNSYVWRIRMNAGAVNADNIADVQGRLTALVNQMSRDYPNLFTFNPLLNLLNGYTNRVGNTEGPVTLLSGAILILMLYHLVTTVGLVLEQQTGEWSSMSSRGASTFQLILLQGLTMILLGGVGFLVGPLLATLVLQLLMWVGPLASATGGIVAITSVPTNAVLLSAVAAVAAVIVLTIPALPAARRSLAEFKQIAARPPMRPVWARYWLDLVLILVGIGFMARLLFFISGDLGQTLTLLINDPRRLIQLLLDSANKTGGLGDPLNLLGPALLLTGIALFWLRLFPAIMAFISRGLRRNNGLTGPLAVWNVERDPGHYAQLVLLLIGTLALGTAALALGFTRDQGTWAAARQAVGGAARVDLDPKTAQSAQVEWTKLSGVSAATVLTRAETQYQVGQFQTYLIGVNPLEMAQAFPESADAVKPLIGQQVDLAAGVKLPSDAKQVRINVRAADDSRRSQTPQRLTVALTLRDALGVPTILTLAGDWSNPKAWAVFAGDVPPLPNGRGPWSITGIQLVPFIPEVKEITGALYFDALQAVDASGKATTLDDFESNPPVWVSNERNLFGLDRQSGDAASGSSFLRIIFRVSRSGPDPVEGASDRDVQQAQGNAFPTVQIVANTSKQSPVPVIISARMAEDEGRATRSDKLPLTVGATGKVELLFPGGTTNLTYKIVGITRSFPSLADNEHFLIMDSVAVAQIVNSVAAANARVAPNQVWLEMPDREPSPAFDAAIKHIPGIVNVAPAWGRYNQLLREPLPAAIAGILYAGFWASLLLSLLDFGFYLAVTARRRSLGFAVLQALGWNANNIWALLVAEQAALVIPAVLVGVVLGAALAYVILPFLALVGGETLRLPVASLIGLLITLLVGFGILLFGTAWWLRRLNVNRVLRLGEE
ncbi:MAG: ABC transporter permease [Anaerolineae bacterium]|nr:ABC transporter permease [Anaerolineae bacterium]